MKSLPGGEDWLLAPVHAQMCRYESLLDGVLSLGDIALMNDSLAVRADNDAAWRRQQEQKRG
ncbi:hypothetical protein WK39_03115 [Burkholderia cepacia]|uniref:DUF6889 family protein n=1 Tax=Burkholderia cepacia TaxID=292 RepID=UPI00075EC6E7|nr:hypothetical protein [Burkholderia cepacia]KVS53282.1 hypothetical protein WK39_03115 [Burkholderia cepacia]KVS57746.1 hypothetical protein WK40_25565 [Burkholderia cepacia]CAG9268995.1 conserved hypothetical protein [Burkholderia cepacia]